MRTFLQLDDEERLINELLPLVQASRGEQLAEILKLAEDLAEDRSKAFLEDVLQIY